jgi:hypothetical protein
VDPARIIDVAGQVTLDAAGRRFALAPLGDREYRFVGWSQARTLQLTATAVLARSRHGRDVTTRTLPLTSRSLQGVRPWPR